MPELPSWACAIEQTSSQFFDRSSSCYQAQSNLFGTITADAINTRGLLCYYYPMKLDTEYDELMKEDRDQYVERRFNVMVYSADYPNILRNVALEGLINPERSTFTIAKIHFTAASTYVGNTPDMEPALPAPRIGDLIYIRAMKLIFRILQVRDTDQQFQFDQHTWTITVAQMIDNIYRIAQHPSILPGDPIYSVFSDSIPFSAKLMTEDEGGNRRLNTETPERIKTEDEDLLVITDGPGNEQLQTEGEVGIITDDGRDKTQHIRGHDFFDDHPIIKKTKDSFKYKKRLTETEPLNSPANPFGRW